VAPHWQFFGQHDSPSNLAESRYPRTSRPRFELSPDRKMEVRAILGVATVLVVRIWCIEIFDPRLIIFPREGRLWNFGGTHKIHKRFLTKSTGTGA